jgi:ABC-2 type transport system ATP-binding protein
VSGPDLNSLAEQLTGIPGIDMVAPFGTSLHVAGRDADRLDTALAGFRRRPELAFSDSDPSLEDVFIDLMSRAKDNFQ